MLPECQGFIYTNRGYRSSYFKPQHAPIVSSDFVIGRPRRLEDVELEVVAVVVAASLRILVLPSPVVDRNPHFLRIAIVQALAALVVIRRPVVLGIIEVRI